MSVSFPSAETPDLDVSWGWWYDWHFTLKALPLLKTSDPDLSSLIEAVIPTITYMYNILKKETHFSLYKVPCGDMSVTDMLVNLPLAAKFPSCMLICVKRPKALTLAMGYLVLLNVRVKADTWNLTSVLMLSFSVCSVPFKQKSTTSIYHVQGLTMSLIKNQFPISLHCTTLIQ